MNKKFEVLTLAFSVFFVFIIAGASLTSYSQIHNSNQPQSFTQKGTLMSLNDFTVINNLQQYGIDVIQSNDMRFNLELNRYLGSNNIVLPLVSASTPLVFLIKNNSNKEIIGVSLRWNLIKADGTAITSPEMISTPGVLMGITPHDPWMIGKTSLINGGEVKLFSYYDVVGKFVLRQHKNFRNPNKVTTLNVEQIQGAITAVESQKAVGKGFVRVVLSVDGILFNDGAFVGEDQNFFFDVINGSVQARKEFRQKLNEGKSIGKNDSEVLNQIILHPPKDIFMNEEDKLPFFRDRRDAFERSRKSSLNNLLNDVKGKRTKFSDKSIIDELLLSNREPKFPQKIR